MFSLFFGEMGALSGKNIFGDIGKMLNMGVGDLVGKELKRAIFHQHSTHKDKGKHFDFGQDFSSYGKMIPLIYGSARVAGTLLWKGNIQESVAHHSKKMDMFGINKETIDEYHYHLSFAVAISEGPIDEVTRVFINGKRVNLSKMHYRVYKGLENQMPDSLIEASIGINKVPAYRGLAYIVFENFSLKEYGYEIPHFEFEVKRRMLDYHNDDIPLEDKIEDMVIIPGSGEFVYDTELQFKREGRYIGNRFVETSKDIPINQNNDKFVPDVVLSTEHLMQECKNLKWVAPVVGWFSNSMNLDEMEILPGIEFRYNHVTSPDSWNVGHFNRYSAYEVSKDAGGSPNYGGTSSDGSVLRYLDYLKSKGLKILFYPMLYLDVQGKPWRGHITGSANQVNKFFNKQNGYKNFILHYARLVKGKVDAFIIGSELVGLTKITDIYNNYPAVNLLIELAAEVKKILGPNVMVSYAADWSEYHHAENGWYHLDKLWASPYIDFVGIDAYFPLTNQIFENYNEDQVKKGWESGEGYDYYLDNNEKKALSPEYAWKNIKYWWENEHVNPNGEKTGWHPRMKKIWFTEIGFPSVDCSANQPNVFYNKTSVDGGLPRHSKGAIDYQAQYSALNASFDYWKNSEFVERKFVWCWDARPYPYWPDCSHIWKDSDSYARGHWLNGKIGFSSLSAILYDFCKRAKIDQKKIDFCNIKDKLEGLVIKNNEDICSLISNLQDIYYFDVIEVLNNIQFSKQGSKEYYKIKSSEFIPIDRSSYLKIDIKGENEIPNFFRFAHYNNLENYELQIHEYRSKNSYGEEKNFMSYLICGRQKAEMITNQIMRSLYSKKSLYRFALPIKYLFLSIGDVIEIENEGQIVRILAISIMQDMKIMIIAESFSDKNHDICSYSYEKSNPDITHEQKALFHVLKLPMLPFETTESNRVLIAVEGKSQGWKGGVIMSANGEKYYALNHIIGEVISLENDDLKLYQTQGDKMILGEYLILIDQEILEIQIDSNEDLINAKIIKRGLLNTSLNTDMEYKKYIVLNKDLINYTIKDENDSLDFKII